MARHKVVAFAVDLIAEGNAVAVHIETELKNPYNFELRPDANYPTVQDIEEKVREALQHCIDTFEKVDVSIFAERSYVNINVKDHIITRFTGKRV